MHDFLVFLGKWADAIGEVFGKYPVAAALVTAVALLVFLLLRASLKIEDWDETTLLFFGVLLGWMICVPLLGWLFAAFGTAFNFAKFLYGKYEDQPIFFLIVTGFAILFGVIWAWVFARFGPSTSRKIITVIAAWLVFILLGVPILNQLSPPQARPNEGSDRPLPNAGLVP